MLVCFLCLNLTFVDRHFKILLHRCAAYSNYPTAWACCICFCGGILLKHCQTIFWFVWGLISDSLHVSTRSTWLQVLLLYKCKIFCLCIMVSSVQLNCSLIGLALKNSVQQVKKASKYPRPQLKNLKEAHSMVYCYECGFLGQS